MKFSLAPVVALFATAIVQASPLEARKALDVFVPPVTAPVEDAVWHIGSRQLVTWDTKSAPVQITNKIGRIQLRKGELITDTVLAEGFDILDGQHEVIVPNVTSSDDYSIVLFGDSGNYSPQFCIVDFCYDY